ncbi:MAG: hypothetical protein ACYSTS_16645 [Planctomycetota bacterium]
MKKLILIIMFLLLCPSLILAEKKTSILQGNDNIIASLSIVNDMLRDIINENQNAYFKIASLYAIGYKDLANQVQENSVIDDQFVTDSFIKHSDKYKYSISNDYDMYLLCHRSIKNYIGGYIQGMTQSLRIVFKTHKDLADYYKNNVLNLYEESENHLKKKVKGKDINKKIVKGKDEGKDEGKDKEIENRETKK